ncbi:MAG: tRNA (adenosine(37)-N6)-dimethylallyltransferase MiaA [Phycisphaerales bacterium]|nr:MAG: tRNA (adenosine(37)-N6)-dimethylallyltransferase MiaA [Phycisphaerales bacterium]
MPVRLDFIVGCTASGKGSLAHALARRLDAEIISVDAMKVYRRMDIGTAKPGPERRREVHYHLIDVVEPQDSFSVGRYRGLAEQAIADIHARGKRVILCGGTTLYTKAISEGLFDGPPADPAFRARLRDRATAEGTATLHAELARVDPEAAARIHPNDLRRIERALEVFELTGRPITDLQTQWNQQHPAYDCRFVGLRRDKEDQSRRINARVKRMMEAGFLDEVKSLLKEPPLSEQARQALGYAELIAYLQGTPLVGSTGRPTLEDAVEAIKINTRKFAKAQRTWLKRFRSARWIDVGPDDSADMVVRSALPFLTEEAP